MCDHPFFVCGVVHIVELLWGGETSCPQPHPSCELGVYGVISGPTVHQSFCFSLVVTGANRSQYLHRSEAHNIHRVTMKCPHPGHRVQACGKSSCFHMVWRIKSFTSLLSFPTPFNQSLARSSTVGPLGSISRVLALLPPSWVVCSVIT